MIRWGDKDKLPTARATDMDHRVVPSSFRLEMVLTDGEESLVTGTDYHWLKRVAESVRAINRLVSYRILTEKGMEVCSYFG
jgi:hypothetical protein